jgi:pentalenene oxygenase
VTTTTFTTGVAPGAQPLVGHGMEMQTRPLDFLQSLHHHGDLVEIKLGEESAFVVCNPDLLHHVLTQDRVFDKGGVFYDRVRDTVGNGLGNCPYADHRRQRRLIQPAFQPSQLAKYGPAMESEIAALTDSWRPGEVVDLYQELYGLCLRILTRTLFSTQVDADTVDAIQRSSKATLAMMVKRMSSPDPTPDLSSPEDRHYQESHDHLKGEVNRLIAECRRTGANHGDLLSMLITSREGDSGTGLTDTEIQDHVINLLLAGSETPAAVLTWAVHLMTRYPEAGARLREEVDTVRAGRAPTRDDVPRLLFAGRFLTETMRLYPPAWMVTRITTEPVELAGRVLPEGTTIVFCPPAVHRNGNVYPDPDGFDPDRWIPGRESTPSRSNFVAFGGAARRCLGDNYSMGEMVLTLATIASRWEPSEAEGTDVHPVTAGAQRPSRLLVRFAAR